MATKNTDDRLDRRCPYCGFESLKDTTGHTGGQRALALLRKAKELLPDDDYQGIGVVEEAIEYLECGE